MSDRVFGELVTGLDVEEAARSTLALWMPDYLGWLERKYEKATGSLMQPRSWVSSGDVDRWPEEQFPSVLLLNTGLSGEPDKDGSGVYRARFALGIAVIVSARDRRVTDELAKLYIAAIRKILLDHPSLGGFARAVEWVDERYDILPSRNRRQLAAGQVVFRVEVGNVATAKMGPATPSEIPSEPPRDDPTIVETEINLSSSLDLTGP